MCEWEGVKCSGEDTGRRDKEGGRFFKLRVNSPVQQREKEEKIRVEAGRNGWRKMSSVVCDKRVSTRVKRKVEESLARAAKL